MFGCEVSHIQKKIYFQGPLYLGPVNRQSQLPGRVLFSVHIGNFSPVGWDEIQETKLKWWSINLYHL